MRLRLFIVAAVVLTVFAIIASAAASGELFSVQAIIWLEAGLLAFFVDCLLGGWGIGVGGGSAAPQ